ncbi:hypothetical protein EUX98_g4940 [Antrodiella citrinella]|uniref:GST N-terminal domain-containing protein n=1 Tax=Antrodiella citrinella TaxID=2447956 RepID=A0A4S4MV77_9APHY|nr:hypothetical protein EUX98_g4940 [Antrodiella citrinella]
MRAFHLPNHIKTAFPVLLEELEVPYEIQKYQRNPDLSCPEYREVYPLGVAPAIQDGDTTLGESGAIVDYILEKYDACAKFQPPQTGKLDDLYSYAKRMFERPAYKRVLEKGGEYRDVYGPPKL